MPQTPDSKLPAERPTNWWVYKYNAKKRGHWNECLREEGDFEWGSVDSGKGMDELSKGDMVIAYQVDTRELFGLCMVTRIIRGEIYFKWIEQFRQKVPLLKESDPDGVGNIHAFKGGGKCGPFTKFLKQKQSD